VGGEENHHPQHRTMNKKAISPVIATVLLIVMVVVISLIIFMWFNNLNQEAITKFEDKNIQLVCGDVQLQVNYDSGSLSIFNSGNVPVYNIYLKLEGDGSYETKELKIISDNWLDTGLNQGETFLDNNFAGHIGSATNMVLIPELMGSSDKGDQKHLCEERHGYELTI